MIPYGWIFRTVKQFGKVVSGGTPDTNNPAFWNGDIYWITPSEISCLRSKYTYKTQRMITQEGLVNSSAHLLPANSLIICTRATIGDCCINKVEMCTNQGFKNILVNKGNNVEFLYYLILQNKNEFIRKACGSTFLEISKNDVEKLKFIVPPLAEQEKIAQILATWDSAIEQIQSLIYEKKQLRYTLAEKLLSNNLWPDTELYNLLDYEQPSKYLVSNVLDFDNDKLPVLTANKSFIIGSTDDDIGVYDKGECIIFDDFTTDMKYVDFKFKVKSSAIKILTPKSGVCLKFVFEQMKRINYPRGGHKRYWLSEFQYLTIRLPDIITQRKIADVLMTADAEIDLLKRQLDAITEQKRGLMQKLLTGQIRVKVDKK